MRFSELAQCGHRITLETSPCLRGIIVKHGENGEASRTFWHRDVMELPPGSTPVQDWIDEVHAYERVDDRAPEAVDSP